MSTMQIVPDKIVAITASDSTDYTGIRAIYVGSTAGGAQVTVRNREGTTVAFAGLVAGSTILTGEIDRVMSTATTASSLVGYYTK